ncbi:hypothetical protein VTK26DRAFT_1659 [Humicola hyalothermophila]
MKFSTTALALGMAALTWGKAVQNVAPHRRNGHLAVNGANSVKGTEAQIAELSRLIGLNRGQGVEINFLWVNLGGGAATTVLGTASTVTVTQTVGGDATAPPAVITGDPAASAPPTATVAPGAGATHSVMVGGPQGLAFSPQELNPAIGDTVIFTFLSQNHTATQSTFDKPCEALEGGMDSGFQANPNNTVNPPPQVAMQVMVDTPLWFYCRQGNHCGRGMVFSLNPTAEKTHAQFQANAIAQKGNGEGGAITGNPPAGGDPNASAPPAADPTATATGTGAAPPAATNTGIVVGDGRVAPDGSCVCAVQCSFGNFPNMAVQGRDSFGGFGGSVPMEMVQAQPAKFRV